MDKTTNSAYRTSSTNGGSAISAAAADIQKLPAPRPSPPLEMSGPPGSIAAAPAPTPPPAPSSSSLFGVMHNQYHPSTMTASPYDYDAYRMAINDLSGYRSSSSRTPTTTYKNSITHPINVSWMIPSWLNVLLQEDMRLPKGVRDLNDLADRERLPDLMTPSLEEALARAQQRYPNWRPRGNMGLCSCPGKKVRLDGPVNGRAKIERDLDLDFARLQQLGCKRVICCLFDEELAFLGSPFPQYLQAATNHGIDVVRIPMVEGSTPETFIEMEAVLDKIDETTKAGDSVIAHCRGGVGRAAVVACCWMLRQGLIQDNRSVIAWVRRYRTSKAIETDEQEFYLEGYHIWKTTNGHPAFAKHFEDELMLRRRRKEDFQLRARQAQELDIARAQRKAFQEEEDVEQRERELRVEAALEEKRLAATAPLPGQAFSASSLPPPRESMVPDNEFDFSLAASPVPTSLQRQPGQ
ncbi:hypothetical protein DFQ27_009789 [Actinomortierella ambigua]|uniref:Tyrosine specific protein phosphatases domain-containing protein n=1 Tax=Actinomortierella ambigua TaxID=1343610 RepID=A0A9P6QGY6_9FUNG|nr:hypothetical protein DFQ27_009789 [Actinomortierella ambigua]